MSDVQNPPAEDAGPVSIPAATEGVEPVASPSVENIAPPAAPAGESGASAGVPPAETAAPAPPREESKPRLAPVVDPEQARPIPYAPLTSAAVSAPTPHQAEPAGMPMVTPREPVDIPKSESVTLDAETVREIEAALASGELGAVAPPPPAEKPLPAGPRGERERGERKEKKKGKVVSVGPEDVIVDLGMRESGCVPARQFEGKLPEVGAEIDVFIDRVDEVKGLVHCSLPRAPRTNAAWAELQVGQIVDCVVNKTNKGGLEVQIGSLRGFLPAGQIDLGYVANLDQYVGQKLRAKVLEVNPVKRNLVVSRRAFLEGERAEMREALWSKLDVGQQFTGTVKTLKDYGAFVDIGGVDGLLHVGEISWSRVNHPSDVLREGQQIQVAIVSIDRDKSKISLTMKQLQQNPWANVESRFPANSVVQGTVTKTTEFGAFVDLGDGVEGLIHISELEHRRVNRVTDVVSPGQTVSAKVINVDIGRKRIALSLKALSGAPEPQQERRSDVDLAPSGDTPYERKRKGPLRGGTGSSDSGTLFFGGRHDG